MMSAAVAEKGGRQDAGITSSQRVMVIREVTS